MIYATGSLSDNTEIALYITCSSCGMGKDIGHMASSREIARYAQSCFILLKGNPYYISYCNVYWQLVLKPFLTLKATITTAADDIHLYIFFFFFSEKIRLDNSCESSARQRIHMDLQALFSSKNKS